MGGWHSVSHHEGIAQMLLCAQVNVWVFLLPAAAVNVCRCQLQGLPAAQQGQQQWQGS